MRITFLSDTHNKHYQIPKDHLPGGDMVIHAGDISGMGYREEIRQFLNWYERLDYIYKIFIAGNHDWGFQEKPEEIKELLAEYPNIIYLQDSLVDIDGLTVYGSPWQPEFYNWAFNLPRNGEELNGKWKAIPEGIDILITHGPPHGILDVSAWGNTCGCEVLHDEIMNRIKPKIHVFGHIHHSYGHAERNGINFVNACSLNERYNYQNKPVTIDFDVETKMITFV